MHVSFGLSAQPKVQFAICFLQNIIFVALNLLLTKKIVICELVIVRKSVKIVKLAMSWNEKMSKDQVL